MKLPLYFLSVVLYFWVPVLVMASWLLPKKDRLDKTAFWLTLAIFLPMATVMEYVYLWLDIWSFSEHFDRLLGPRFWGAPLEEFVFWYGAPPFVLLTYWALCKAFPAKTTADA